MTRSREWQSPHTTEIGTRLLDILFMNNSTKCWSYKHVQLYVRIIICECEFSPLVLKVKMSKGSQSSQAYMCDSENHCIQIFSWSLEFIRLIGTEGSRVGQLSRPHDLAVDSKGAPLHLHCGKQLSSVLHPRVRPQGQWEVTYQVLCTLLTSFLWALSVQDISFD